VIFVGSQDDSGTSEVLKLKRRFLKDRTVEGSFFAKVEMRKKLARKVRKPDFQQKIYFWSCTGITTETEGSQR